MLVVEAPSDSHVALAHRSWLKLPSLNALSGSQSTGRLDVAQLSTLFKHVAGVSLSDTTGILTQDSLPAADVGSEYALARIKRRTQTACTRRVDYISYQLICRRHSLVDSRHSSIHLNCIQLSRAQLYATQCC